VGDNNLFTAHYVVTSAAALAGLPKSTFASAGGKATFATALASILSGVDVASVSTTSVTAPSVTSSLVNFTIQASLSYTEAFAIADVIAAAGTPAAFMVAQNSGLAALSGYSGPLLRAPSDVVFASPVVSLPPAKVNLSDVSDATVAAATANVAQQFADLSLNATVELQSSFLMSLDNETYTVEGDDGGLSLGQAAASASLLLAIVSSANTSLTTDNQAAALDILTRIATAPIDATAGTAQNVVSALSTVTSSALGDGNAAALLQVGAVIDQLSVSQAKSMVAALNVPGAEPPKPVITDTPSIKTLVAVDPPGSSRLYSMPLTVPGSASSFAPMPAGLLPTTSSVVTSFFALTFDPNGGNSTLNTTGLTRLAFSNADGTPIVVANATTPIRFSLPPVDTAGNDAQAVCSFWDVEQNAYSTTGCAGVPSPYPAGHTVVFLENFTAHSDAELAMAWNISGPMVENGTCFTAVLDCTSDNPGPYFMDSETRELVPSHHPAIIYPDPYDPLSVPAVACQSPTGNETAPPPQRTLRVYYGTDCASTRAARCAPPLPPMSPALHAHAARTLMRLPICPSLFPRRRAVAGGQRVELQLVQHEASIRGHRLREQRLHAVHVPPPDRFCQCARAQG
jgi:hypothetical protein